MTIYCRLRRARPHPKPAGRKSAAERREEPRRSSRGPLCPQGTGPRGERAHRERVPPAAAPAARKGRPCQGRAPPRQRRGRGRQRGGHPRATRSGARVQRSGAAAPRLKAARRPRPRGGLRKVGRMGETARGEDGGGMGGSAANGGRHAKGGKVRPRKRERLAQGGSDCTRYAVMIYCGPKAALLMSFQTGRHLFLPRFRATIPHKRVN